MSDSLNDSIINFLDRGIYLETRSISIDFEDDIDDDDKGEITKKCAIQTLKKIHILDNYKEGTINIFINNPGGSVEDGMAIYDAIVACKNFVRGYVYGAADSMASIILQACDERVISPSSRIMIHDGSVSYPTDHHKNIKNWQDYNTKLDEQCYEIYLNKIRKKHPTYRKQDLKRRMIHDMIFCGQEAIDFGLADRLAKRGEFNG